MLENTSKEPAWADDYPELAAERYIAKSVVKDAANLSDATIDRKVRDGTFPRPIKTSHNRRAWRLADVVAWLRDPESWSRDH